MKTRTLRIPDELNERIAELAEHHFRSVNDEILNAIQEYVRTNTGAVAKKRSSAREGAREEE